jgi:hypothetical protein
MAGLRQRSFCGRQALARSTPTRRTRLRAECAGRLPSLVLVHRFKSVVPMARSRSAYVRRAERRALAACAEGRAHGPLIGPAPPGGRYLRLGRTKGQIDFRAAYGIVAPTGRFEAGADDNVGSGYWTHALSSGATFCLSEDRSNALSAFVMYELHEKQETTDVRPGDTLTLDGSWMHVNARRPDRLIQYGAVGYAQWQTSDKRGPDVTPEEARDHYRVYALGLAAGFTWPYGAPAWRPSCSANSTRAPRTRGIRSSCRRRSRSSRRCRSVARISSRWPAAQRQPVTSRS